MPFLGDLFTHLFDWEKDPQRQEKTINARLEAEFDGVDTALSTVKATGTALAAPQYAVAAASSDLANERVLTNTATITWDFSTAGQAKANGGDVVGPSSATDNAIARFDTTTGKLIQNSSASVSDAGSLNCTQLTVNMTSVVAAQSMIQTDAGPFGPGVQYWHNSASPAFGDRFFDIAGSFNSSTGVQRTGFQYYAIILDTTNGSEDGELRWFTIVNGSVVQQCAFGDGVTIGSPTGGMKGNGAINCSDAYNDNVALTCMALSDEFLSKGEIDLPKWDAMVPDAVEPERVDRVRKTKRKSVQRTRLERVEGGAKYKTETVEVDVPQSKLTYILDDNGIILDAIEEDAYNIITIPEKRTPRRHELAHRFKAMCDNGFDPRDPVQYIAKLKREQALPGMPTQVEWEHNKIGTGELFCRQWLAMEMLAIVVMNHEERIAALEAKK